MTLLFDLAIHTAKLGRSRSIDRYAKAAAHSNEIGEGHTLAAMRGAKSSVWRIERHHEVTSPIVTDMLRGSETWLIDEALTISAHAGLRFASRLCWPTDFAMTCGVVVPVDAELTERVVVGTHKRIQRSEPNQWTGNPRLAAAIYRTTIEAGIIDSVDFTEHMTAA
jgi:hypothetical protein